MLADVHAAVVRRARSARPRVERRADGKVHPEHTPTAIVADGQRLAHVHLVSVPNNQDIEGNVVQQPYRFLFRAEIQVHPVAVSFYMYVAVIHYLSPCRGTSSETFDVSRREMQHKAVVRS